MLKIILNPEFLHLVLAAVAVMAFVAANGLVLVYMERKIAGHIQRRPGPYEVGWHGILQPIVASRWGHPASPCLNFSERIRFLPIRVTWWNRYLF